MAPKSVGKMNCSEKAKNAPARNEAGSAGNFPRSLLLGRISLARRGQVLPAGAADVLVGRAFGNEDEVDAAVILACAGGFTNAG
jgi:hypothetical protein